MTRREQIVCFLYSEEVSWPLTKERLNAGGVSIYVLDAEEVWIYEGGALIYLVIGYVVATLSLDRSVSLDMVYIWAYEKYRMYCLFSHFYLHKLSNKAILNKAFDVLSLYRVGGCRRHKMKAYIKLYQIFITKL